MSGARVSYAEAGAAMREVMARACAARISATEHRVLSAVLSLIGTYSRTSDALTVGQVARAAQVHERTARAALARLAELEIIDRTPTRGRVPALITLPQPGSHATRVACDPGSATADGVSTRVACDPPTEKGSEQKDPPLPPAERGESLSQVSTPGPPHHAVVADPPFPGMARGDDSADPIDRPHRRRRTAAERRADREAEEARRRRQKDAEREAARKAAWAAEDAALAGLSDAERTAARERALAETEVGREFLERRPRAAAGGRP